MKNKKKPFIISIANEKGGSGKSTLATHLSIGLLYRNKDLKIGFLDLDTRQLSSYNFFEKRKNYSNLVPSLYSVKTLKRSDQDSKQSAFLEDFASIEREIDETLDILIIDTAGNYTNMTKLGVYFADIILTPVMEGFFDLDAIIRFDKYEKNIINGPFFELLYEQRQNRIRDKKSDFDWMIILNRISIIKSENSKNLISFLNNWKRNLNFDLFNGIYDRNIYKELCSHGLTVFDLPESDLKQSHIKACEEMNLLIDNIYKYYDIFLEKDVFYKIQKFL